MTIRSPSCSVATYSLLVCSTSSGPRGVPYMAWIGRGSSLSAKHHHVRGNPCACLGHGSIAHQNKRHKLVPFLPSFSARRFEAAPFCPEASFNKSVAPWVVPGCPPLANAKQPADLEHHLRPKNLCLGHSGVLGWLRGAPLFRTPISVPPSWLSGPEWGNTQAISKLHWPVFYLPTFSRVSPNPKSGHNVTQKRNLNLEQLTFLGFQLQSCC